MGNGVTVPHTLSAAFARYQQIIMPHKAASVVAATPGAAVITSILVEVADLDETVLQLETDETYTLQLGGSSAGLAGHIVAKTVYGALRALETVSQLISFSFDNEQYQVASAPWDIQDAPRFHHRGKW